MIVCDSFQDILDASSKIAALSLPVMKWNILKIEYRNPNVDVENGSPGQAVPFAGSEVFDAPISGWRRLTAEDTSCKSVYEVSFDITGRNLVFEPGDTIGIVPQNNRTEVDLIIRHLDLNTKAEVPYTLRAENNKIPSHVPAKSTLRHVLTHCLDLRSVLKKLFILALSQHAKEENERKVLEYMSSKEGSITYTTHILNKNLCIIDLLNIFKSCKPPIELLLTYLPRLLPRPYSIANSCLKDPNVLKICFSVMDIGNNRKGLVTGEIEEMITKKSSLEIAMSNLDLNTKKVENKMEIYLRKNISGFHIPKDLEKPLIMIGPGTGIAPFIGFLEERETASLMDSELKLGEAWLFFGCRRPELDFIYEKELLDFLSKGVLDKLETAFSRVDDAECKYVQDALSKRGKEIVRLIENGASVYICGDLKKMAGQIREVLTTCLIDSGKSLTQAEELLSRLQKEKRYFVDAWS